MTKLSRLVAHGVTADDAEAPEESELVPASVLVRHVASIAR
jgi:hypothetical protein